MNHYSISNLRSLPQGYPNFVRDTRTLFGIPEGEGLEGLEGLEGAVLLILRNSLCYLWLTWTKYGLTLGTIRLPI